jgi:hypothetical protein
MTTQPRAKMTVDEFLVWAERQPKRYVIVDGEVFAMSLERARHARVKAAVYVALVRAIRGAALPCEALPDGMTVRIDVRTAYEPDALVYCSERRRGDAIEVPNPMIVAEVVSPGTKGEDTGGSSRATSPSPVSSITSSSTWSCARSFTTAARARSSRRGSRARGRSGSTRRDWTFPSATSSPNLEDEAAAALGHAVAPRARAATGAIVPAAGTIHRSQDGTPARLLTIFSYYAYYPMNSPSP